jgi:hypothetical protein
MNIKPLIHLPWKLWNALRSLRRDLAEILRILAEIAPAISALRSEEMASLRETLIGEIREHGLLAETAARFSLRTAAEMKLRSRLTTPQTRRRGVSVLITCWNHAGYLSRSVASAIAAIDALPAPGEVVILDDASLDGSREVAADLAGRDERIRLIAADENLGLPRARNILLSQARFEHAVILDSDNQLVASGIDLLFAAARQTGAVLAYGNVVRVDESGSVIDVIGNERASANLFRENWIDAMAMVDTGRLLELGGYD